MISSPRTNETDEIDARTLSPYEVSSSGSPFSLASSVCEEQPRGMSNKGTMELLPKEIEMVIPKLYTQEQVDDPIVYLKFFDPSGSWTWFATEGERQSDGDFLFFGRVDGFESEFGYFSLRELESVRGRLGLGIERDLNQPFSSIPSDDRVVSSAFSDLGAGGRRFDPGRPDQSVARVLRLLGRLRAPRPGRGQLRLRVS